MGQVGERLAAHSRIALDTTIFIYHFEANRRYLALTTELFAGVEAGIWSAVLSTVSIMEILVHPWKLNAGAVAAEYEALIVNFPNLSIADVTRDVAREAARLRATLNLRPPDALVVATAIIHEATAFVTNDRTLARARTRFDVLLLDELLDGP